MNRRKSSLGDLLRKVATGADLAISTARKTKEEAEAKAKSLDDQYGIRAKARDTLGKAGDVCHLAEEAYGQARKAVTPQRSATSPRQLVEYTRRELHYIIACVLQISRKGAELWSDRLGRAIASKLAAAGTTGSLLTLVAAYGTAGTGAAISGLSGAAATSATLAWVGGLVGGGMVAGSILTGGVGLLVGFASYKAFGSKARSFEDLSPIDQKVVETCGTLVATIDEMLPCIDNDSLPVEELEVLYRKVLVPLHEDLERNSADICSRLDSKNAIAFRQHAIKDFEKNVLDQFSTYLSTNRSHLARFSESYVEYVIGGVFYALLSRSAVGNDDESQMVLEAIRRSDNTLRDATEKEITDKFAEYSPKQLQGIANNVKGINHELAYVRHYNETNTDTYAVLHEDTNNPGGDIQIRDSQSHEVLKEVQLKATDSAYSIKEHQQEYPNVEILVTEEIALESGHVESSGFRNRDLENQVDSDVGNLANNTELDQMIESAGLAGLISTGRNAVEVLQGKKSVSRSTQSVIDSMTISSASTGLAAFLFS